MLTDPRLSKPVAKLKAQVARLEALAQNAEDWNDPRVTSQGASSGKPSGRAPGMAKCDSLVKQLATVLTDATVSLKQSVDTAEKKTAKARPFEAKPEHVETVGGLKVTSNADAVMKALRTARRTGRPLSECIEEAAKW